MAHETNTGSSPIVKGLMNNLREILPDDQRPTLDQYAEQAEALDSPRETSSGPGTACIGRSRRPRARSIRICPGVAIRLKETHKAWQDIWLGTEFGFQVEHRQGPGLARGQGDQKIGPGEDIELLWVEEATDVAKSAAEKSGWENVPWEALLRDVLEIN